MAQRPSDPLTRFGSIEAPTLSLAEKGQQIAIGLGFCAAVFLVLGPSFLALTKPVAAYLGAL
jgi:hypothetical protein